MAQWLMTSIHEDVALLSELRIQRQCEMWSRLQTRLRFQVAVAVVKASGYSSDLTPSLGTSMCSKYSPKKKRGRDLFLSHATWMGLAGGICFAFVLT